MSALTFDLRASVAGHPWPAVAIAFAVGAAIAFAERSRSPLVRAAGLAAGSALLSIIRERASREVAMHAQSWMGDGVDNGISA